ncbi:purine-nucleoside phosphorylase [Desulfococcaceae bacterium HSG7]|nr:purine-nucleoside phosphorylase [Desulfococcaceae bacterium HSG7]
MVNGSKLKPGTNTLINKKYGKRYTQKVNETKKYLQSYLHDRPRIGILTGTGLGESIGAMAIQTSLAYQDIPNFPESTVQSHHGRLLIGTIQNIPTIAMQGRFHLYEGYSPYEATFPIRVMQSLGVKILILTNAAGGLNLTFSAGNIMIIADHINLTGLNPLIGQNEDSWGVRFPDMLNAYDPTLMSLAQQTDVHLRKGVYAGLSGPSLETPAEIRFLKTIGADAVGFSTVHEVIVGVHASMKILALSILTNIHNLDTPVAVKVDEVIAVAQAAAPRLSVIIENVIAKAGPIHLQTSPSNKPSAL